MEKPVISPQFTIEDIHKLREYHYYLTRDMTDQGRMDFYNNAAKALQEEIERKYSMKGQEEEDESSS